MRTGQYNMFGRETTRTRTLAGPAHRPGTSLGGARPKANFTDDQRLWIAKFPAKDARRRVAAHGVRHSGLNREAPVARRNSTKEKAPHLHEAPNHV